MENNRLIQKSSTCIKVLSLIVIFIYSSNINAQTVNSVTNDNTVYYVSSVNTAAIDVTYTVSLNFTAGNIFTAELSNAAGAFGAPVNIGTRTAINGGIINATIPAATASGAAYRVRITTTNPVTTSLSSAAFQIILDNAAPTVSSVTPNHTTVSDDEDGGVNFTLTVVFNEDMNETVNPTISFPFGGEDPAPSIVFSSGTWSNSTTYVASYTVADNNLDMPDIDIRVIGAEDLAGNTQTTYNEADKFSVEMLNPTVTPNVTPNVTPIVDATVGPGTFRLTVAFNEPMNTGVNPSITFPNGTENPTTTIITHSNNWPDNQTFELNYTVTDNDVNLQDIDIRVTGAEDLAGNTLTLYNENDNFSIDMNNANVTSITPSPAMIADADVGASNFTLTVVFDKNMNTGTDPTVSFPTVGENPWTTTSLSNLATNWPNATTFVATYDINDVNEEMLDIDVRVAGAVDLAGNTQVQEDDANNFDIDTENPTIITFTENHNIITDANAGGGQFTFTVVYSENMNTGINPTISFPFDNPATTLTLSNENWSNATTFVATYDVADNNQVLADIDVRLTGATDVNGNGHAQYDEADNFSIEMSNPTVTSVTPAPVLIADAQAGGNNFTITVAYDEVMTTDGSADPTISFPIVVENPSNTITQVSDAWAGNDYTATYNVVDPNETVVDIDVQVTGGEDAVGNPQGLYTASDNFDIDNENPAVLSVTPNITMITDGNLGVGSFTITVVFNETMGAAFPTITFPTGGEDPTSTIVNRSDSWSNATTFVATYDVTDVNEDITNIDVRVALAQDAAGNTQIQYDAGNSFSIDTENPAVTSVVASSDPIIDVDAGAASFTLTASFNQNMDALSTPVLTFYNESPVTTLSNVVGSWSSATTYVFTYDVTDANQVLPDIDVRVTGATDVNGNGHVQYDEADNFSIEMSNPSVTTVTPSPLTISDSDAGAGNFTLTIDFSEFMIDDGSANPDISFPVEIPGGTLAFASGNWLDADTYIATYNVSDMGLDLSNIDVRVENAEDDVTNPQTPAQHDAVNIFNIDMANPTLNPLTIISNNTNNTSLAMVGDIVTISFTVSETLAALPVVTIGGLPANETNVGGLNYTATRTLTGGEPEVLTNFNITFSDVSGNNGSATNVDITDASSVTFDFTAPNNQNTVFPGNLTSLGGRAVTIVSSADINNKVWFAPAGQTLESQFIAGTDMTIATDGLATSILAPADAAVYNLYVIDEAGNVSIASTSTLTVNNTCQLANIEGAALNYTENNPPVAITNSITVDDDSDNIVSATIQITANYQNGEDLLAFTDVPPIIGNWNAVTGAITLSGADTRENYQAAIRSITYENNSELPNVAVRTVNYTINDGFGDSNTEARNINITSVNDDPVFTSTPVTAAQEDVQYTYEITGSDVDNMLVGGDFSIVTGPAWLSLDGGGAGDERLIGTPANPVPGFNHVENLVLQIDDGNGGVVTQSFSIVVTADIQVPADYTTIQQAIDAAITGDIITVANGTYTENIDFDGKELEIVGNAADPSQVIIEGDGTDAVVTFEGGEAGSTSFNGFTVTNGGGHSGLAASPSLHAPSSGYYGGGIFIYQSGPILLKNIIVENNTLAVNNNHGGSGAGIYIGNSSNVTIEGPNTIIQNNTSATYRGGGICIDNSTVNADGIVPGGITINNNNGGNYGGGVALFESVINITDITVINNNANGANGSGGGVYSHASTINQSGIVNVSANAATVVGNDLHVF